jgi:hypothetical protein
MSPHFDLEITPQFVLFQIIRQGPINIPELGVTPFDKVRVIAAYNPNQFNQAYRYPRSKALLGRPQ